MLRLLGRQRPRLGGPRRSPTLISPSTAPGNQQSAAASWSCRNRTARSRQTSCPWSIRTEYVIDHRSDPKTLGQARKSTDANRITPIIALRLAKMRAPSSGLLLSLDQYKH